jgi:hypothetical protein
VPAREDAYAELTQLFNTLGLPSTLAAWAWDRIVAGKSQTEILLEIEQTQEFKNRFKGIQAARDAGITPLSPAEYIAYEAAAGETARRYGLSEEFYQVGNAGFDDRLAAAMANGVSARQYLERLNDGFARVSDGPTEIREGFRRLYGVAGDAALATVFLDPENAQATLERMAAAAEISGTGGRFGLDVGRQRAEELGAYDLELDELRRGYGELADVDELFDERTSETRDLVAENEGINAVFNLDQDARDALKRRQAEREALTSGAGGGQQGVRGAPGLGTAR